MTMTTPRIAPLAVDDPEGLPANIGSDRNGGRPLNIFLTLAKNQDLFAAFSKLGTFLLFKGDLPAREREIVILRVGWRSQSEYEFGQHTVIGRDAGLTDEEIARLAHEDIGGWNDDDAALVRMADELCANDFVSEETWQALSKRWQDSDLLELMTLAGFYRLVSGFLNSAGVALEPTTPGWPAGVGDVRRAPREASR